MRVFAWLSDIHLDMVSEDIFLQCMKQIRESDACGIWLTGDIATGRDVDLWLKRIQKETDLPVYFVLGNHDYYHSSVEEVEHMVRSLCVSEAEFFWMDAEDPIWISEKDVLVGVGGWGDAKSGDFETTPIRINDHRFIENFSDISRAQLKILLQERGEMMAETLFEKLQQCKKASTIWVLTHVPPFPQACWFQGRFGDPTWTPDFVCASVGDALQKFATQYSTINIRVLCGHGHNRGYVQMEPNLVIYTAAADYSKPVVETFWSIGRR